MKYYFILKTRLGDFNYSNLIFNKVIEKILNYSS
jgi:hypothetical protein